MNNNQTTIELQKQNKIIFSQLYCKYLELATRLRAEFARHFCIYTHAYATCEVGTKQGDLSSAGGRATQGLCPQLSFKAPYRMLRVNKIHTK